MPPKLCTNTLTIHCFEHCLLYSLYDQTFFFCRVLFWTEEQGSSFVIRRCVLNGGVPEDVHTSPAEPLDLSVDLVNGDLYWVTEGGVCSSDLNGGSLNCFQCCSGAVPSGLVVFEVYIYISLRTNNSVVQIEKMRTGTYAILCLQLNASALPHIDKVLCVLLSSRMAFPISYFPIRSVN